MKARLLYLLALLLAIFGPVVGQTVIRLNANSVMQADAFTTSNSNNLITGVNANASGTFNWARVSKTGSSLADLTTRSATDLTSGTLPDARFPATLPALSGVNLTALNATQLTSGTVPNARLDADLQTFAGITPSANVQSYLGAADYSAMRTQLGLVIGTNVQAYDADLGSWALITRAAGFDTFTATPSGANLASLLTTALPASKGGTGLTALSANVVSLLGAADYAAMRTQLTLVPGTDVQAYDADLASIAGNATGGFLTRTAANTYTPRTITGTAGQITVTNGDGVSGAPTISLPSTITQATTIAASGGLTLNSTSDGSTLLTFRDFAGTSRFLVNQANSGSLGFFGSVTTFTKVAELTDAAIGAGKFQVNYTTPSTSTATGSGVFAGGLGVGGALYGTTANFSGVVTLSGTTTASVANGASIHSSTGTGYASFQQIFSQQNAANTDAMAMGQTGATYAGAVGSLGNSQAFLYAPARFTIARGGGATNAYHFDSTALTITPTTASSATTNGALIVAGGVGVAGNVNVGGNTVTTGTVSAAAGAHVSGTPTIASSGGLMLKLGVIASSPSNSSDAMIAVHNTGGPGATAGDLLYIARSSAAGAHRWFTGNGGAITNQMTLTNGGSLLIGTTTDSSNGIIQLTTHTSSAGGIGFGTDVSLYRLTSGNLQVLPPINTPVNFDLLRSAGQVGYYRVMDRAGGRRWAFGGTGTAESGSNAGSDYAIHAYDDSNVFIDSPLIITRAAGGSAAWARPLTSTGLIKSSSATGGIGYATGAGGAQTQATSRTTTVTLDKVTGAITLFTAAGSTTPTSFTVSNSTVAATDTIVLSVKSSTNKYLAFVTAVAAGSFEITFYTTGGTSSDAPVINFAVIKAVAS